MAIDQDTAAAFSAQIERIRTEQIIPDPRDEAESKGNNAARPVRWANGKFESASVVGDIYVCYAPLNDAMSPALPEGECGIFREAGAKDFEDGDIVTAILYVRNIVDKDDNAYELAYVIRQFNRLPDGRIRLTPFQEGYAAWTEGDLTRFGLLEIAIVGVLVSHEGVLFHPHSGNTLFIPKSETAA